MKDFEWCTNCKEYDHEKHCCPRWTKVIRNTLDGNINAVLEDIRAEIEQLHHHPKLDFINNDEVVEMALAIIDKYREGEQE